jgi:transcriptional regulator with XRE-family HTH domain
LKSIGTIVLDARVKRAEAEIFGTRLRALRERRGMSQEELANVVSGHGGRLTSRYVSDLERGLKAPTLTMLLKLCRALETPLMELLEDFTPAVIERLQLE